MFLFDDRAHAGTVLAGELEPEVDEDAVVVGLARGGIVVAAAVAQAFGLPLEMVAVRKVRHPWQPEYALGAVAPGAQAYVRARDGLTNDQLAIAVGAARAEAEALDRTLRDGRPQPSLAGQTVLLVDDGLATGATMIAAARWASELGAQRIVAAAPVGARETVDLLKREADKVVCPYAVDDLVAVGLRYADPRNRPGRVPQQRIKTCSYLMRAARAARSARAIGWDAPLTMAREPAAAVWARTGLPHPAAFPEHPDPRHELAGPDPPQPSPCWR